MTIRRQFVLDDVSRAIIEQLQEDGRRPYARIAAAVGLSEAAVRQRVQRLLDAGVMQIVGVTDPLQVGFSRQAMVGVRTSGDARTAAERIAGARRSYVDVEEDRPAERGEVYSIDTPPPTASGSRGLATGLFTDRDGRMIATVVQEGLVRLPKPR